MRWTWRRLLLEKRILEWADMVYGKSTERGGCGGPWRGGSGGSKSMTFTVSPTGALGDALRPSAVSVAITVIVCEKIKENDGGPLYHAPELGGPAHTSTRRNCLELLSLACL
jgi:hypothetical protein